MDGMHSARCMCDRQNPRGLPCVHARRLLWTRDDGLLCSLRRPPVPVTVPRVSRVPMHSRAAVWPTARGSGAPQHQQGVYQAPVGSGLLTLKETRAPYAPQSTGYSIDQLASRPLRGCRGQRAAGCGASGCGFTSGYWSIDAKESSSALCAPEYRVFHRPANIQSLAGLQRPARRWMRRLGVCGTTS